MSTTVAMSATSSCDDRRHNAWLAFKTPPPRTGLDDDDRIDRRALGLGIGHGQGQGLGDIFASNSRWRCDSVEDVMQQKSRSGTDQKDPPTGPLRGARSTSHPSPIPIPIPFPIPFHHSWTAPRPGECTLNLDLLQCLQARIADALYQWSWLREQSPPSKDSWLAELLTASENWTAEEIEPPPSYDDSARDIPPPYTGRQTTVQSPLLPEPRLGAVDPHKRMERAWPHLMTPKPDWADTSTFRQAAGKGKKKNQKKGDQDPWGSGDEGKKDAGADEKKDGDAGDGGVGGAGAGAAGGDDGDGGAGDGGGDDEWNSGKKKKKGKKGKAALDEEEEEKKMEEEREMKRQEEEDAKKKKEEEEAGTAGGPPPWPEGGDADAGAEWGFSKAEKKGKKGKKAKAEEDEKRKKEEEEEIKRTEEEAAAAAAAAATDAKVADPLSWADDAQADYGGDWGAFAAKEKKGKKGKKGVEEADEKKKSEGEAAASMSPLAWADGDNAEADTSWNAFLPADKKGKKSKKAKVRKTNWE